MLAVFVSGLIKQKCMYNMLNCNEFGIMETGDGIDLRRGHFLSME